MVWPVLVVFGITCFFFFFTTKTKQHCTTIMDCPNIPLYDTINGCLTTGEQVPDILKFSKPHSTKISGSGVNGKPVYRFLFRLGRNDEIHKEYLSTGY